MSGGRILDSMMRSVNFYSAKLQFVDFTGSDLRKADFREINGRGTIWTGARFTNCDFRSAQFHKTTATKLDEQTKRGIRQYATRL